MTQSILAKSRVLLSAPDWLTARGIQQVLQAAGHQVIPAEEHAVPADAGSVDLGLVVIDDGSPVGSSPVVSFCAGYHVPVIWLLRGGHLERLLTVSAVRTVGLLIMPVHEAQLLAAVAVGLSLARQSREAMAASAVRPVPPLVPMDLGSFGAAVATLPLTDRQRVIVMMLLGGDRVSTIATELMVRPSTVRAHLNRIYEKLGVHSQALLIRAFKTGQLPGAPPPTE